jgi:hypothetical protein
MAAIPSCRPANPSPSFVVALTLIADSGTRQGNGDRRAHSLSIRGQLRGLSDHCRVNIDDLVACRGSEGVNSIQKREATDIAKRLLAGGKLEADVPERARPQDGIRDRVEQHIRVGMPFQAQFKRNLDTAQDESPPRDESVNVIADAGFDHVHTIPRHVAERIQNPGILLGRKFQVPLVTRDQCDSSARHLDQGRFVGHLQVAVLRLGKTAAERRSPEGLGRLGAEEIGAVHGLDPLAGPSLDRVGNG